MNQILSILKFARHSFIVLFVIIFCAVYIGWNWTKETKELIRLDELWHDGFVEVTVEGQGESLDQAKEDAKKNALEFVNGTMIETNIFVTSSGSQTMTAEMSNFRHEDNKDETYRANGSADFKSIQYIQSWKDQEDDYHVKLKAIVRSRHLTPQDR
ncbi:MAG: hypothetical protein LBJ67_09805 [Planctomycetaceae bacterium]|jgi:hypothetical protein|nr:hypothetical protein [Planctomycetaceae bacterium]